MAKKELYEISSRRGKIYLHACSLRQAVYIATFHRKFKDIDNVCLVKEHKRCKLDLSELREDPWKHS